MNDILITHGGSLAALGLVLLLALAGWVCDRRGRGTNADVEPPRERRANG
jgi:hypothetical protein